MYDKVRRCKGCGTVLPNTAEFADLVCYSCDLSLTLAGERAEQEAAAQGYDPNEDCLK